MITAEEAKALLDAATPGELTMDLRWADGAVINCPHPVAALLNAAPDLAQAVIDQAAELAEARGTIKTLSDSYRRARGDIRRGRRSAWRALDGAEPKGAESPGGSDG